MKPITFAEFTEGDGLTSTVEVRNPQNKTLFDPDDIVMRILDPAGTESAVTPVRLDTGIYQATYVFNAPGTWYQQWKISGSSEAVHEQTILVKRSQFT